MIHLCFSKKKSIKLKENKNNNPVVLFIFVKFVRKIHDLNMYCYIYTIYFSVISQSISSNYTIETTN